MSKTKTLTSEGEELAGQYEARQQVRAERAALATPQQRAALKGEELPEPEPAPEPVAE